MLYTLIIIIALSGEDHRSGGSVHTQSVQGFTTEQACLNAAKKIVLPNTNQYFKVTATTSCVANTI